MEDMLLMLYPVLGQLGPKGGWWGGMERSSNGVVIAKIRMRYNQVTGVQRCVFLIECTEFMKNMFLMFYQVLGSLGAEGGRSEERRVGKECRSWGSRLRWR